jgi:chromosome condensin MukBEF MukE localization factor
MEQLDKNRFALPHLSQVFDELRKGRHLCVEDGELYHSLQKDYDSFRGLFHSLGFDLVRHPRDFFYFRSDLAFTPIARRVAVFMFILIEHLANEVASVEEALTSGYIFIDSLPHQASNRYRRYMDEAGITVDKCINTLARLGFVEYQGGRKFRFRSPVYRFVDLCLAVLSDREQGKQHESDSSLDEIDDISLLLDLRDEEEIND